MRREELDFFVLIFITWRLTDEQFFLTDFGSNSMMMILMNESCGRWGYLNLGNALQTIDLNMFLFFLDKMNEPVVC